MRHLFLSWAWLIGCIAATAFAAAARGEAEPAENTAKTVEHLRAGPIHVKLEDGQLRYLQVGDKEICRRIYFGVRDGNWATAMPTYTQMKVDKGEDHFTVNLAAVCKMGAVDYSWAGTIIGAADGKITFQATGTPNADFESNRIGLCVLFGSASLAKQAFETDGKPEKGVFPPLVSGTHIADQFHRLQYKTADGLTVTCSSEGAIFDMEDQRNWGDSSWKAFAPLPYAYKKVGKGDVKSETVTITVTGAEAITAAAPKHGPVKVKLGQPIEGRRLPVLSAASPGAAAGDFSAISFEHDKYAALKQVTWPYTPTIHLPDNDTIIENLPTIAEQARTVHSFNAGAALHVGPILLSGDKADPRLNQPIAAAWAVAMVKSLALGGVEEAAFDFKQDLPAAGLIAVRPYSQHQLLAVEKTPAHGSGLTTFAAENFDGVGLFLVNHGGHRVQVEVEGIRQAKVGVLHVGIGATDQAADVKDGILRLELEPYGVCRLTLNKENH